MALATRVKAIASRLEAIANRHKEKRNGRKVQYSSDKKLLVAPGITTSNKVRY